MKDLTTLSVTCVLCQTEHYLAVQDVQITRYMRGSSVQEAFPQLDATQRELIISKTCGACWDAMFPSEEEEDCDNTSNGDMGDITQEEYDERMDAMFPSEKEYDNTCPSCDLTFYTSVPLDADVNRHCADCQGVNYKAPMFENGQASDLQVLKDTIQDYYFVGTLVWRESDKHPLGGCWMTASYYDKEKFTCYSEAFTHLMTIKGGMQHASK